MERQRATKRKRKEKSQDRRGGSANARDTGETLEKRKEQDEDTEKEEKEEAPVCDPAGEGKSEREEEDNYAHKHYDPLLPEGCWYRIERGVKIYSADDLESLKRLIKYSME